MEIVLTIFTALGGPTAIARGVGAPVQTVHSWKSAGAIPKWRRPAVLSMAQKRRLDLPNEALAYLAEVGAGKRAIN